MDSEQTRKIISLDRSMLGVRNDLTELESFGFHSLLPDPTEFYNELKEQLAQCQRDIEALPAANQEERETLVIREGVLLESLNAAGREALKLLGLEQRAFFHDRAEFTAPLDDAIAEADRILVEAVAQLCSSLQTRWTAMQRRSEIVRLLSVISELHNTSPRIGVLPPRLPKPFSHRVDLHGWGKFIQVFLARVGEVFEGGENALPEDLARTVFERPERIDIGQDQGYRSSRQYLESQKE